jgi:2-iminobutanoate/2-iminopropanoate deaminase
MKSIYTSKGANPRAPYSQAMVTGNLVFTAGQIGLLPGTGDPEVRIITEQAEKACRNIKAILEEAGTSCDKVVKANCYLTDIAYFNEFNAVYEKYFPHHPARTCVSVSALPLGFNCEIEVIAEL